jgi:porphyrinogen peroxidase
MPFGRIGSGEYGTYFIGYARSPATTEQMLTNMFVGSPPGNYDRILDVSTAVTGSLFFVPSQPLLDGLADENEAGGADVDDADLTAQPFHPVGPAQLAGDGSLNIGSLRGDASI